MGSHCGWVFQNNLKKLPHPEAEARGQGPAGPPTVLPGNTFGLALLPFPKVQVLTPEPSIFGVQQQPAPLSGAPPLSWSPIFVPWAMGAAEVAGPCSEAHRESNGLNVPVNTSENLRPLVRLLPLNSVP